MAFKSVVPYRHLYYSETTALQITPIHEHDIPSLAPDTSTSTTISSSTSLSFCIPTSMAFFKRLTWEQTPWIGHTINGVLSNPINHTDATLISQHLSSHLNKSISPEAVQNALLFGSTYPPINTDEPLGSWPHLFIIFPHATQNPAKNPSFIQHWHDDIVKPAFDESWKASALTPIYPMATAMPGRFATAADERTWTNKDARPALGFLNHLRNRKHNPHPARTYWPVWSDGGRIEGKHSGTRAAVYADAWESVAGALKGHPDLSEYQDPVLLAVNRGRMVFFERGLSETEKVGLVAGEWDRYVDSRFVEEGSFRVVFEAVVGVGKLGGEVREGKEDENSDDNGDDSSVTLVGQDEFVKEEKV